MNDEQKALFQQVQLAGLGIVIAGVGLFTRHAILPWIGLGVFVLAAARTFLIRKLIGQIKEEENSQKEGKDF